ncbi:MAG TPA: hypothetical protein VFY40_11050 [Blastocatellia bacterium]|nr:hypothetical protein [Blastocatellia bacterium]
MREEFSLHLRTLIRLRYRLIWARMRTSNGGIILFFALYLLGASLAFLMAFGGLGAAIMASRFDDGGSAPQWAQWALTMLFINGLGLSLMFGLGTQEAFSEEWLRRYPLKVKERFIIRQIIGLMDPIWAFVAAGAFGLAAGFGLFGGGRIILGGLGAALFVAASYLATVCLLSFIGRIMRSRAASSTLGILVLALLSFGPLAFSLLITSGSEGVWKQIGRLLPFTPSGAAAAMMAPPPADGWGGGVSAAALLVVWVAALALLLKKVESLRLGAEANSSGGMSDGFGGFWDSFYDRIAGMFGRRYAPLVSKSLRYHLRCNLIRFSLLTSPLLVLFPKFLIGGRDNRAEITLTLGLFFITGGFTGVSMNLNLFGYDGAGVRRYAVLPSTFVTALRAGSLASLLLRAVALLAAVAVWIIFARKQFDAGILLLALEFAVTGLFLFNAFGLWTSVLSPKAADFNAIWNNRLSFGANVVMFCGGAVFGITMALSNFIDPSELLRFWPLGLVMTALSLAFYLFSMKMIEPVVNREREKLINLIAGARNN